MSLPFSFLLKGEGGKKKTLAMLLSPPRRADALRVSVFVFQTGGRSHQRDSRARERGRKTRARVSARERERKRGLLEFWLQEHQEQRIAPTFLHSCSLAPKPGAPRLFPPRGLSLRERFFSLMRRETRLPGRTPANRRTISRALVRLDCLWW